jgi:thiol-disulfide isomerase/thioredoxin
MRALLVLVVACANPVVAPGPVKPSPPPPAPPPPPTTSAEIIARVDAAYANATTYQDRGEVVEKFTSTGHAGFVRTLSFTTAFRRTGGFRFEYFNERDPHAAYTIHSTNNGDALVHWYVRPAQAEHLPLGLALAGATGVSMGVAALVPRMLGLGMGHPILQGLELRASRELVDDHVCWLFDGMRRDEKIEVWIDHETYLVRRIHETSHLDPHDGTHQPFDVDETISYVPLADAPIADAKLAPIDLAGLTLVEHPKALWIGVGLEKSTSRIDSVFEGSPAAKAGFRIGDEIVDVDGVPVSNVNEFRLQVARYRIGQKLPIALRRNGAAMSIVVEVAERPDLDDLAVTQLVGKPAPNLTATMLDGTVATIAPGKVTVLDFWATWCKPCELTRPTIEAVRTKHPNIDIIGISNEDEATIRAYAAAHPITYSVARDDGASARSYLVDGIPRFVLIDKTGVVRFVGIGIDGAQALEAEIAKLATSP